MKYFFLLTLSLIFGRVNSSHFTKGRFALLTKKLKAPETVDFNVNGRCNLDCKWCWGPVHNAKEELSIDDWKQIATKLKFSGTKSIVFTGGETLLKKELPELVSHVKENLNMRTTLSSNGLLMVKRGPSVLPYVDDLGLPLDGHTVEVNSVMRKGTALHFSKVLEAMRFVQENYPKTELTVRTVAAKPNLESVPLIGRAMLAAGINPSNMRWKIYQVSPIGPRKEQILNGDLLVSHKEFDEAVKIARTINPDFSIEAQPYEKSIGRYFHIFPDGKSHMVAQGEDGLPAEIAMGNIAHDFTGVMEKVHASFNFSKNSSHGTE